MRGATMQNPATGELTALTEEMFDDQGVPKVAKGWPVYKVGQTVCFKGWWWGITGIVGGHLTIKPVRKAKLTEALAEARFNPNKK